MPADSASNGGSPSNRLARVPRGHPREASASVRRDETVEALTTALGHLRRGAAALNAENNLLRAEIEALRPEANRPRDAAECRAPKSASWPRSSCRAAPWRPEPPAMVIDHCLSGLVAPWILQNARLLASELVTNSVRYGDVEGGTIVLRMDLTAQTLRLEIENAGTAGVVELRSESAGGRRWLRPRARRDADDSLGRHAGPRHERLARDGTCLNGGRVRNPSARRAAGTGASLGRPGNRTRRDRRRGSRLTRGHDVDHRPRRDPRSRRGDLTATWSARSPSPRRWRVRVAKPVSLHSSRRHVRLTCRLTGRCEPLRRRRSRLHPPSAPRPRMRP